MPTPLFAIHLADGTVGPAVWAAGFAATAALLAFALWRVPDDEIPRIGVLSAAFFVASQVHLPLGGASVHLLLNGLVGVVLGRRAPIAIAVGLFLQSFLFGHGADHARVNVWVYAVPATAAGLLFRPVRRRRVLPDFWLGVLFGVATAAATVLLNFLVLRYLGAEDWTRLAQIVLLAHLPVVAVEAVGVGFVTQYLGKVKPDWLA